MVNTLLDRADRIPLTNSGTPRERKHIIQKSVTPKQNHRRKLLTSVTRLPILSLPSRTSLFYHTLEAPLKRSLEYNKMKAIKSATSLLKLKIGIFQDQEIELHKKKKTGTLFKR